MWTGYPEVPSAAALSVLLSPAVKWYLLKWGENVMTSTGFEGVYIESLDQLVDLGFEFKFFSFQ